MQNSLISRTGTSSRVFCQMLLYAAWDDSEFNAWLLARRGVGAVEKAASGSRGVSGAVGSAGSTAARSLQSVAVPVGCVPPNARCRA